MENKIKNGEKPIAGMFDAVGMIEPGLTKREYACIKLGIPETGDEELDDLIRKAERKRLAGIAIQGLLANKEMAEYSHAAVADWAIVATEELLKQLGE